MLGPEALVSWADMSNADQSRSASLLLDAVEKGAFLLANNLYEARFSDRAPNVGTLTFSSIFLSYSPQTSSSSRLVCTSGPLMHRSGGVRVKYRGGHTGPEVP